MTYLIVGGLFFVVCVICAVADRTQSIPVLDAYNVLDTAPLPIALKRSGWKGDFYTKRGM